MSVEHELQARCYRAWLATMLVFAVEIGTLPFRYAFALAGSGWDKVELGLLSFALATWMSPCVVGVVLLTRWLRVPARRWPHLGALTQVLVLLITGLLISVSQHGHPLTAPKPWEAAVLMLPAVALALLWRMAPQSRDPSESGASALTGAAFALFYLATFETAMLFATAKFGLGRITELERTLTVLGVPAGILVCGALSPRWLQWRPAAASRLAALATAALGLVLLQHVNVSYFVDLHQPVHTALLWGSLYLAWWASGLLLDVLRRHRPPRARTAFITFVIAAGLVAALARNTVAGYVAGLHSAQARAGMEALSFVVRGPLAAVSFRIDAITRFVLEARGSRVPDSALPLPSTFAMHEPNPALARLSADANLVVFILDAKRANDIGPDARGNTRTPTIDRCFRGGANFRSAISNATQTLLVFPSIYSSIYAGSHGQFRPDLLEHPAWLAQQHGDRNLVELLKKAGFSTRVLTNAYYLQYLRGAKYRHLFGRFDTVVVADESKGQNQGLISSLEQHPELISTDRRFLLVVHIMSHGLTALPEVDSVVGTVCSKLQSKGLLDRTAMMLTADHGFQVGEHGRTTYGRTLFDEELHVPLLWRIPGFPGARIEEPVSSLDHLPTIADLLGIRMSFPVEGRSYLTALLGGNLDPDRPLYFEVRRHEIASTGVLQHGLKLIHWHGSDSKALFDLSEDPHETRNLVADPRHEQAFVELSTLIERFRAERGEAN